MVFPSKSLLTNIVALFLLLIAFLVPINWQKYFLYTALFALSGALTNWLAVHMIFHRVPLLYGSGVIERNFDRFKISLQSMIMEQFFTHEQIDNFLKQTEAHIDLAPLVMDIDLDPTFESLKNTILESKFGAVVGMFGGASLLDNHKDTLVQKLRSNLSHIVSSQTFVEQLKTYIAHSNHTHDITLKIESLVSRRIEELTPLAVKELALDLMRVHLGWLVVWGGVFGGLLGLISSFVF